MKKVILSFVAVIAFAFVSNAQTEKGSKLIEINTGFGNEQVGGTGFYFLKAKDFDAAWNIGAEGGQFVMDDLAAKIGLGLGNNGSSSTFGFKVGGEYYINSKFPVELSLNGTKFEDEDLGLHGGLQAGYAWFIRENIALKPGVRYNVALSDVNEDKDFFQGNVGFTWFLN